MKYFNKLPTNLSDNTMVQHFKFVKKIVIAQIIIIICFFRIKMTKFLKLKLFTFKDSQLFKICVGNNIYAQL